MTHTHTFTVEGRGAFPYDMLRYDQCFPLTGDDSANMQQHVTERRSVTLTRISDRSAWLPTAARWSSFTWAVVNESYQRT